MSSPTGSAEYTGLYNIAAGNAKPAASTPNGTPLGHGQGRTHRSPAGHLWRHSARCGQHVRLRRPIYLHNVHPQLDYGRTGQRPYRRPLASIRALSPALRLFALRDGQLNLLSHRFRRPLCTLRSDRGRCSLGGAPPQPPDHHLRRRALRRDPARRPRRLRAPAFLPSTPPNNDQLVDSPRACSTA